VLYDLDIEAKERCEGHGVAYTRARCVHDHPAFIAMLAERVAAARTRTST
jgi:protoheme ferro-lyase